MFSGATSFNKGKIHIFDFLYAMLWFDNQRRNLLILYLNWKDLSSWDVSNVLFFSGMFQNATQFNGNLSLWDTRSGTSFSFMFQNAVSFSSDISGWDTARATSMRAMFRNATSFNSNLYQWDVGQARDTASMFADASNFNADLSRWEIDNVDNMDAMFSGARAFSQNLCAWGTRIRSIFVNVASMFSSSACPVTDEPDLSLNPHGPFCFICAWFLFFVWGMDDTHKQQQWDLTVKLVTCIFLATWSITQLAQDWLWGCGSVGNHGVEFVSQDECLIVRI